MVDSSWILEAAELPVQLEIPLQRDSMSNGVRESVALLLNNHHTCPGEWLVC